MAYQNELVLPAFEKQIDGETYEIRMLDGVVGFGLYTRLLTCAGAALQALGKLDVKAESNHTETAMKAIGALLGSLPPDLYEEARALFAENTVVFKASGQKPRLKNVFGVHFAGRYAHMSKWLIECFKVNFADFLDETGPLAGLTSLVSKLSQSQPVSTGSATDS